MASLGLVAVVACAKTSKQTTPPPPPVVAITAIRANGGTEIASDCGGNCCLEVSPDANATVVLSVDPTGLNFLLRPPGMCGQNTQCGYLAVELDPSDSGSLSSVRAATTDVVVPVADLTGPHRIYVELRHQDDQPVRDATGQPVHAALDVVLSPPGGCSGAPEAGTADGSTADAGEEGDDQGELDASEEAADEGADAAPDAQSAEDAGEDADATGG